MDLAAQGVISDPYKRYNDLNYAKYALMDWKYSKTIQCELSISHLVWNPGETGCCSFLGMVLWNSAV